MNDWKLARTIYFSSFRFSSYRKKNCFDAELSKKLSSIERIYATAVVLILGIILSILLGGKTFGLVMCVLWILMDLLIINPLIYYAVLPKPIGAHVMEGKPPEGNPEEEKLQDLLKKYETGEERYRRKK